MYSTNYDLQKLEAPALKDMTEGEQTAALGARLPERVLPDTNVPEFVPLTEEQTANLEDLSALSALPPPPEEAPEAPAAPDALEGAPLAPLEEGELEEVWSQPIQQQQQQQQQQPYIVIPMNSAQAQAFPQQQGALVAPLAAPPPASVKPPPIPGAPPMISVDKSESALQAQGLQGQGQGQGQGPIRSALRRNTNATRRVGFSDQPRAPQQAQGQPANVRVNVIKQGS